MNRPLTRRSFVLHSASAAGALGVSRFLPAKNSIKAAQPGALIQPVSYEDVAITDSFWRPKMEKVATATLRACIIQTEEKTARIRNFEKVARKQGERHEGF